MGVPGIFVCHLGYCALSCLMTFLFTFLTCLLCLIPPDWSFFCYRVEKSCLNDSHNTFTSGAEEYHYQKSLKQCCKSTRFYLF